MGRIHSRVKRDSQHGGGPVTAVTFSSGVAVYSDIADLMAEDPSVSEIGLPGVQHTEATAGNAAVTLTVPAGKYWRLLGMYHVLVTDGNAANREVVVKARNAADGVLDTITHAVVTLSTTAKRTTLFGIDDYVVGNEAVAAQGTLTVDTIAAEDEVIVLNGVTFTWKDALVPGTANQLLVGANVAASKAALEAAFVDRDNGGVLHSVSDAVYASVEMTAIAFATNDMVFTANVKGTLGDALATTTTMAGGTNAWGASTLGDTTTGVDAADKLGTLDYPTSGVLLGPGFDVNISVTAGVAGDAYDTTLVYLEYDANPTP